MKELSALGLPCPKPILLLKNCLETEEHTNLFPLSILVDNEAAVQNVSKWGKNYKFDVQCEKIDLSTWKLTLCANSSVQAELAQSLNSPTPLASQPSSVSIPEGLPTLPRQGQGFGLFVGKDHIGEGDPELGRKLIELFFFTLTQSQNLPHTIVFMNSGAFLSAQNTAIQDHLRCLEEKGCTLLTCGTCLQFYGLPTPPVGEVSNLYEIWEKLSQSASIVSL